MVSRRFVEGYWWGTRSFFLEKRKNQRKIDFVFLPRVVLSSVGLGDYYIGRYASVLFGRYRSKSQRRLLHKRSCPTALYVASWLLFQDSALYLHISQLIPTPFRPFFSPCHYKLNWFSAHLHSKMIDNYPAVWDTIYRYLSVAQQDRAFAS